MSDYKQFRADLAKTFWGDDKLGGTPQEMATRAVSCADALIAELERTEKCPACEQLGCECLGCGLVAQRKEDEELEQPEPPQPATRPLPPVLADEKEAQP